MIERAHCNKMVWIGCTQCISGLPVKVHQFIQIAGGRGGPRFTHNRIKSNGALVSVVFANTRQKCLPVVGIKSIEMLAYK